jgi:putative ATP-binding cassette transporter
VQSSLRWFVDNFSTIADWRATLLRVAGFRRAVLNADDMHEVASRISYAEGEKNAILIEDLQISSPTGCTQLEEKHVEIKGGERVLIVGEPGTGKTLLFRALAGLWPWGAGSVTHPKGQEWLYMPRTPYLPPGTLKEVLTYPLEAAKFSDENCQTALSHLGLDRLKGDLNQTKRWERELNEDEQQCLGFARVALHRPPWLLIDEVLDSMPEEDLKKVIELFSQELKSTAIIHIGRSEGHDGLFSRTLHLIKDPGARVLPQPALQSAKKE